jgi:predicted kinase
VSLDRWRERIAGLRCDHGREGEVLQAAREELREHLRKAQPVVWDATCLRRDLRSQVVQTGFDYHAWVEIVCVSTPMEEIRRRQELRPDATPVAVFDRQVERCEWPFAAQAHSLVTVDGSSASE